MDNEKDDLPVITYGELLNSAKSSNPIDFKLLLKSHRFDFDSVDENGRTVICNLAEANHQATEPFWIMLEYFADPNTKDNLGNTALHYACKNTQRNLILLLLLFGASPEIPNIEEVKPFDLKTFKKEESDPLLEKLSRKRRNKLRKIFEDIDYEQSRTISEKKLISFNQWLNNESEEDARTDARVFIEQSKLFISDEISFEEFIFAMSRIVTKHGLGVIDEFINKFIELSKTKKRNQGDMF